MIMYSDLIPFTDALIFDMDGTLWDATDSYAEVWNRCYAQHGIDLHINGSDLVPYMGKPIEVIAKGLTEGHAPAGFDYSEFVDALLCAEEEMMPQLGGNLYPGVKEGLSVLAQHYHLLMMSNCGRNGLHNFMQFTGTAQLFSGSITYGENPVPKSGNICRLIERHGLRHAVYVGDTQGDCDETHRAGIPFVYASYGFGKCQGYDIAFDSFADFTKFFINIKEKE